MLRVSSFSGAPQRSSETSSEQSSEQLPQQAVFPMVRGVKDEMMRIKDDHFGSKMIEDDLK